MDQKPDSPETSVPFVPKNMGIKVGMLLAFSITVAAALVAYIFHARGTFEDFNRLRLITENAEGVNPGMDLTYAGYPIGKVRRISLKSDGKAIIHVRVPHKYKDWLRTNTQFTLNVGLVGAPKLRAQTAPDHLQDPPLPDNAEKSVLRGDTTDELPGMVAKLREALGNVDRLTESGSSLEQSLANVRTVTERMAGKQGVLGAAFGGEDNAKKLLLTLDRANALLASLNGVSLRLDAVLSKTEQRLYSAGGIADETQKAVTRANAILEEVSASLKKVDAVLADAQTVASNAKVATTDLGALRAEVDASLRKIGALIDEINRKWPFERDTKIKLP